jgi:hypothetical protein
MRRVRMSIIKDYFYVHLGLIKHRLTLIVKLIIVI